MIPTLTTQRLALRPARTDHLDALHAIWADADVRRFLFDDEPITRERAQAVLADCLDAPDGLGLWSVSPRDHESIIGCVGLLPAGAAAEYDASLAGAVEPLAALAPSAWGQGYATEALVAAVGYGFAALGLPAMAAVVDVPNAASHRLVERLGFAPTGECDGPAHRLRTYRLVPDAFAQATGIHVEPLLQ